MFVYRRLGVRYLEIYSAYGQTLGIAAIYYIHMAQWLIIVAP